MLLERRDPAGQAVAELCGGSPPRGWFELDATAESLAATGKLVVSLHRHEILLLWNDGEPVALSNVCIHRGRKLNEGVMLGNRLVCPGHQWAYEITTGYCVARERYQPRYSLELLDGKILVELPAKRGAET